MDRFPQLPHWPDQAAIESLRAAILPSCKRLRDFGPQLSIALQKGIDEIRRNHSPK